MSRFRWLRLVIVSGIVAALLAGMVTAVSAAAPAVSATPAVVPFSETPGQAGTAQVAVTADAGTAYSVCVSDNGANKLVTTVPNGGPTSFAAPFIQAGTYSFFASTSADCANPVGTAAKVQRAGPTGKLGANDFTFAPKDDFTITANQQFPIAGKLCIMSGDGKQKQVNLQLGQDPRVYGATAAVTEMNAIVQGQNGCYAANWLVNGYYKLGFGAAAGSATPGGAQGDAGLDVQFGFCVAANAPDKTDPAPITLDRHCAQIAYATSPVLGGVLTPVTGGLGPTGVLFLNLISTPNIIGVGAGTVINGAAVTGASDRAIQTCLYVALPTGTFINVGGINIPDPLTVANGNLLLFGNNAQGFNGTGAINLTNVVANFGAGAVLLLTTFDVTNPSTPGGLGAGQQSCPGTTALFGLPNIALGITLPALGGVSNVVQNILLPSAPNMQLIDARYFVQLS